MRALFRIGALQERTKAASDTDHATKSAPGMLSCHDETRNSNARSAARACCGSEPSAASGRSRDLTQPFEPHRCTAESTTGSRVFAGRVFRYGIGTASARVGIWSASSAFPHFCVAKCLPQVGR